MFWIAAGFVLLTGTAFVLLQTPRVQTWLAQRAAAYLSAELKTKVTVGKVSIRFVKSVLLKDLYIEDLHHDTLLFAKELLVNIRDFKYSKQNLVVSEFKLDSANFYLTRYQGERHDNIQFLSDYFSSGTDTVAGTSKWKIKLEKIRLQHVTFRHDVQDDSLQREGVDFAHLHVKDINGELDNISILKDSIFLTIHKLRFRDRSNFELTELSTEAKIAPDEMRLNRLVIRTPYTDLHTDLIFRYDSMSAFDDFLTKINFNSDFKNSTVSFNDIAFFAVDLKGMNKSVKLDGNFKGTVSRFKGKNVTINIGDHSFFKGNITMTGLPTIEETYMDILATDVQLNKKDIESIPLPPFNRQNHVVIPDNLTSLGKVNFKGKFTGFISDFVAYGNITTDIGFISSDINVKVDAKKKTTVYSGHLSTNHFDLGKIVSSADIGRLTMSADVKGSGVKLENMDAKLIGTIDAFELKKYTYRGIKINGEVSKKLFTGSFTIHEPNIDLDFAGTVNFKDTLPEFNFTADVDRAHLDTLNFFNLRGEEMLKTRIVSHFKGNKFDNLEGTIGLDSTNFRFDKVMYHINHIFLSSFNTTSSERSVNIRSDNIDADFSGRFNLAALGDAFKQIVPRYLPAAVMADKPVASKEDFTFDIRLKNMSVVTENFFPSWSVDPNTTISGKFNNTDHDLVLNIESPMMRFKNFRFVNTLLHASTDDKKIKLAFNADQLYYADSAFISSPQFHAEASDNSVAFILQMADTSIYPDRANLKGALTFASAKKFDLRFDESTIILENEKWQLGDHSRITFDSSAINVNDLSFSKQAELISIEGVISNNEKDKLSAAFRNFNLRNLNPLLKASDNTIGGIMNGTATVSDVYRKIKLVSNLAIENIQFNNDTLGNAGFVTTFDADKKNIFVDAFIQNGAVKIVAINGQYLTDKENNSLDFSVKLNNFYLNTIGKYIEDVVSELSGRASADLALSGNFSHPVFTGKVNLNRVRCKVNYLNTRYNFTNDITVGENYFELTNFKIFDEKSQSAVANGRITHTYFKHFSFNVDLAADKFQCLNTVATENSIYYGNAIASGKANFSGPLERMNMQIQFTSEKGTEIYIPLTSTSEVSQSNFITFREKGKFNSFNQLTNKVNLSGIRLDMSLDMTPDAEIQIIFDEKIGDKIIGNGYGNLRLDINAVGDFNMYGTYMIEKGTYLFTLQNIINKKFIIERGSIISWGGNPYDADINLDAVYTTTTSTLYKLLQDTTGDYKKRFSVDCKLNLSNKLMNPTIRYSIDVKGLDAADESQIRSMLNSEAEVSKQMFGLLVLNQFIPPSNTNQASNRLDAAASAGSNATELLSNQVNNWLSQVSPNVNIGLNYRPRDIYSKEEFELMFSKSLANDRLLVEGNVGVVGAAGDQTSSLVGDFNAEYKVSEDGRFRIRAFNKSNTSNLLYNNIAPYTQGLGVFYRRDFNTLHDLFKRKKPVAERDTIKSVPPPN